VQNYSELNRGRGETNGKSPMLWTVSVGMGGGPGGASWGGKKQGEGNTTGKGVGGVNQKGAVGS